MARIRLLAAAAILTAGLLAGCGSDSGLRSPDIETLKGLTGAERREWIRTDLLIGLPWRDAEEMAHDAGWATKVIFAVEGEPVIMTMDLKWGQLRLVVVGGEEAGTVERICNC